MGGFFSTSRSISGMLKPSSSLFNWVRFFAFDPRSGKRIKASFRCPNDYKDQFKGAHSLLPISVGQLSHDTQSPHEGAKFEATMELINKAKFAQCTILVDDSIQYDTYSILYPEKSEGELKKMVLAIGDEWIDKHRPFYKKLTMPYKIRRWNDVDSDPDFPKAVEKVRHQYEMDPYYKGAFDANIEVFLNRLQKRSIPFDKLYAVNKCHDYLCKENGAMAFIWTKWGAEFEIYPSGRNLSMAATYQLFIKPDHPKLLQPVSLRFQKRHINPPEKPLSKSDPRLGPW